MKTTLALVIAVLLLVPFALVAHHAFAAEFDVQSPSKFRAPWSRSSGPTRTSGSTWT